MKKSFLLYVAAILIVSSIVGSACRKHIIHSNAPTPNNVRMQAYTKITTITNTTPIAGTPATINENYRFFYDESNRVSKILYTSNDSFEIHKTITFQYIKDISSSRDTIVKTTINTLNNVLVERDTFVFAQGSHDLLEYSMTPFLINKFEYLGKLMTRNTWTATSYRDITMTAQTTYTSVNGDFLRNYYDGNLNVNYHNLRPWLTTYWLQDGKGATTWQYDDDDNDLTNGVPYVLTNYNFHSVYVHVKDSLNAKDSVTFAGTHWVGESYHFYTEDANRTGDYLQLQSFTMYGQNIYQNSHLVESITNGSHNAYIKYIIDAYSKITQTQVVESDSLLNNNTYIYNIQYETY